METLKDILFTITHPSFWLMNEPVDEIWDEKLNELLESETFTERDRYTAFLGNVELWIANYPYDCFHKYEFSQLRSKRPKRRTIYKAMQKYKKECHPNP